MLVLAYIESKLNSHNSKRITLNFCLIAPNLLFCPLLYEYVNNFTCHNQFYIIEVILHNQLYGAKSRKHL